MFVMKQFFMRQKQLQKVLLQKTKNIFRKIMRRVLCKITNGLRDVGNATTLADPNL